MGSETRISVTVPAEMLQALQNYTRESGVPYSELIRRLVSQFLAERQAAAECPE